MLPVYIIGGVALALYLPVYHATRTDNPKLERLRLAVTLGVMRAWGVMCKPEYARALMAIAQMESKGDPNYYIGDVQAATGPSIGPWQVSRGTAKDLGLWSPDPSWSETQERIEYTMLAQNEYRLAIWAAIVLREKLRLSGGDLREAIRRYNGSGPKAEKYAVEAWRIFESFGGIA